MWYSLKEKSMEQLNTEAETIARVMEGLSYSDRVLKSEKRLLHGTGDSYLEAA
jgi:hypothetical protein